MTAIHISVRKPGEDGTLQPVAGSFRFTAVKRYFDAAKNLVIPAGFDAELDEQGAMTIQLMPTTPVFIWKITELAGTDQAYTRWVEVPDSENTVEYADLVDVDPATFAPVAMLGGDLLKVHHADSQADAEAYSAVHPDVLVVFDETASATSATEALASIASIAEEARTNLRAVRSTVASVATDAASVSTLHADVESTARSVTDAAGEATDRIRQAVAQVEAAADEATGANRPATIPEV